MPAPPSGSRRSFSDRALLELPLVPSGQRLVRDTELPDLFVLIGKTTKTFMIQADLRKDRKRQTIRLKVGRVGKIRTREERAEAKRLLGVIADGIDPRPAPPKPKGPPGPPRDPTLREAWEICRESHMRRKHRSAATIASYRDHIERLLRDRLDQPLSRFGEDPGLLRQRHDRMTIENGPQIADAAMRSFHAICNPARRSARGLPAENPVIAVDWHPQRRRDTGMGLADLAKDLTPEQRSELALALEPMFGRAARRLPVRLVLAGEVLAAYVTGAAAAAFPGDLLGRLLRLGPADLAELRAADATDRAFASFREKFDRDLSARGRLTVDKAFIDALRTAVP